MARRIIKGRRIVDDAWRHVADDEALGQGPVIVSLARWQAERELLAGRDEALGLRLPNTARLDAIAADLARFAVIAIEFPVFKDGRGYTLARLLRERHGYAGELRAVGDVLRDQLYFMARAGFDAFEVRADKSIEEALESLDDFSVNYQAAADQPLPLYRRR